MKANNENIIKPQSISLPKGGGSISSLGETFKANSFNGSNNYSIPLPLPSSRGFNPELSINYGSGSGNSEFGLGFSLSLPKISIRTQKKIPQYNQSDIYLVNGQEVVLKDTPFYTEGIYTVYEYLPRVEGSFNSIKHYVKNDSSYWQIISTQNVTTIYGQTQDTQVFNEDNNSQVFEWLIESMEDSKGNKANFYYKEENNDGIGSLIYEQGRACTQKYIEKIEYGNYIEKSIEKYAFHIVFDYGEYSLSTLEEGGVDPYTPTKEWTYRKDAFSSYKSCFEIRTRRRCENILVFNNFEKELGDIALIKRLKLNYTYSEHSLISIFQNVVAYGYDRQGEVATDSYILQTLPPFCFNFSKFSPTSDTSFKELSIDETQNIPGYLNANGFQAIDLYGEGISGLLYSDNETLMYCQPLGQGNYSKPTLVNNFPIDKDLQNQTLSLQDIDGNGELELVVQDEIRQGYYQREELADSITWGSYTPFETYPNYFENSNLESLSLSNNGKNDLVQINNTNVAFYTSLGKKGFKNPKQCMQDVNLPFKKENYPQKLVSFSSFLGDGLSHRIKITKNSVQCWPNLGYGKFGEKITLETDFDFGSNFDTSRLFLADTDGSGTVDIIIVEPEGAKLYVNQNGNTFSNPITITFPETYSSIDQISFADVLGNGTSCLVFTKIAPTPKHYYYNFVGETILEKQNTIVMKPYLLNEIDNNMGAITQFHYTSSTEFYLEDKKNANPWNTKLPFPVQVVQKVVTVDKITHSRFTQSYAYHDGYYDHMEKEFRGFSFVETWDSEDYESYIKNKTKSNYQNDGFSTPIYTKTWYETGDENQQNFDNGKDKPSSYFNGDKDAYNMPANTMPTIEDKNLKNQAFSTIAGKVIRSEVYGYKDNDTLEPTPYSVEASNYEVKIYQELLTNSYGVFTVLPRQSISYNYEKDANDPRVSQSFTLKTDSYINPLITCNVSLPRRTIEDVKIYPEQQRTQIVVSTNSYVTPLKNNLYCHTSWQTQSFEALNIAINPSEYFSFDDIAQKVDEASTKIIPYGEKADSNKLALQQISWNKTIFWDDTFQSSLDESIINPQGLVHHYEEAVFTKEFIQDISNYMNNSLLEDKAGYFLDSSNNYWWNRGLVQFYDIGSFCLPIKTENSFKDTTSSLYSKVEVTYDEYKLYTIKISQYINETTSLDTSSEVDYRVGGFKSVTDANNNLNQSLFDPLGNVYVSSLVGDIDGVQVGGIDLHQYIPKKVENLADVIVNPQDYLQGATSFFYYDLENYQKNSEPNCSLSLVRDEFYYQNSDFSCKMELTYTNGFTKELEKRVKYDDTRWSVTGQSVYNNKGKVVEEYLPYFSDSYLYSKGDISLQSVAPTTMLYDALDRLIRTNTPKGFFSKTEFTPWEQKYYDEDDTVDDSTYYIKFMKKYPTAPTPTEKVEHKALTKASEFYDTPTTEVFDSSGSTFLHIAIKEDSDNSNKNSSNDKIWIELITYSKLDVLGRTLESIDPRLYESNKNEDTNYFNFKYKYTMDSATKDEEGNTTHIPIFTNSIDAGEQVHLNNMYKEQLWSLNSRDYCQLITYDNAQRQNNLYVKNIKNEDIIDYESFDLVEVFTYGAKEEDKTKNLFGQLCELKDLSGISQNNEYSISGNISQSSKQLVKEYKSAINWKNEVELENEIFTTSHTYNALGTTLSESNSSFTTNYTYNSAGQIYSISTSIQESDFSQNIIEEIQYDANGQRVEVIYGNKTSTKYIYENSTLNLTGIKTSKLIDNTPNIQELHYTYDPVGNITQCLNPLDTTIYNINQEVEAVSTYTYNALYQLIEATGRQHPGVSAKTSKDKVYSVLKNINDLESLENYMQYYKYDYAGNLISKQHSATNAYTIKTPVKNNSNRLEEYEYDKAGNLNKSSQNSTTTLTYNCCNNLVSARVIQRENGLHDSDYYLYDSSEHRVRKVVSTYEKDCSVNNIYEKTYIGNYELTKTKKLSGNNEELIEKKEILRVMDGDNCVAIIYNFTKVKEGKDIQENIPLIKYQLANNINSITIELNQEAQIVTYEEYYPYGKTSFMWGKTKLDCDLKTYRYSGKERDDSTGLYYYGRRYYSPGLSRWINADPAGTVDGLNLFALVGGNPVSRVDVDGLMLKKVVKIFSVKAPSFNDFKTYQKSHKSSVNNDINPPIAELNIYIGGTGKTAKESFPNNKSSNKSSYDMHIDGPGVNGDIFTKLQAKITGNGANGMEAITHGILESKKNLENNQLINNKTKINIHGYSRGGTIAAHISNSFANENYKNVSLDMRDPVPGPGHNKSIELNKNISYSKQISLNNTIPLFHMQEISGGNNKTMILSPGGHSAEARDNANQIMPEEEGIFLRQENGSLTRVSGKQAVKALQDEQFPDFNNHIDPLYDSIRRYQISQDIKNNFLEGKK